MNNLKSNEILAQSLRIYNYFSSNEKENINILFKLIKNNEYNEFLDLLWKLDAEIGEIGGYSFSANPVGQAPIARGLGRELFRPLQYARSEFEMHSYPTVRYIVDNLGLHLEIVMKYILRKKIINRLKITNKKTLGNLYYKYFKSEIEDINVNENIQDFITVYNKAKHTINIDPERERNISIFDGIISYIFIRKLTNELLKPYYPEIYKIVDEYRDRFVVSKSIHTNKLNTVKYYEMRFEE